MNFDFRRYLKNYGALWEWNPELETQPHAILTSKMHSNGFINISEFSTYPWKLSIAIEHLKDKLERKMGLTPHVDWVVGSAMGGITIAHEMAKLYGARTAYAEKDADTMALKRFDVRRDSRVLVVEDVSTTGGTSVKTIAALERNGCEVYPFIPSLVSRMPDDRVVLRSGASSTIIYLEKLIYDQWQPDACPLCRSGSTALKPKENWDTFMRR